MVRRETPIEVTTCRAHPAVSLRYRWVWDDADATVEDSTPDYLDSCHLCEEEARLEVEKPGVL